MAAPQIRFLIRADGAPDAVAALRTIREEEQRLAQAEKEAAAASKKLTSERKGGLQGLLGAMTSIRGFMAGAAVSAAAAFGKSLFDASVQADSLRRGLTAVMPAGADVNAELKKLEQTAKQPGLGFPEAIQMSTRLQATGMSADRSRKAIEAFGNALATVGKGKAELEGVALALGQIQSKGKISAEEINQLAERVPQIRVVMEKAFGTANTEILQKANYDVKEFVETLVDELNKLPKAAGGAQNSVENLSDSWFKLKKTMGDEFAPGLISIIDKLNAALEYQDGLIGKILGKVGKAGLLNAVFGPVGSLLPGVGAVWDALNKRPEASAGTFTTQVLSGASAATDPAAKAAAEQDKLRKLLRLGHKKDRDELLQEEEKLYRKQLEQAGTNVELRKEVEKQHQQRLAELMKKGAKKQGKDWRDEILAAQKAANTARLDAERTIQAELLRTQEEDAQRQYEIGALSIEEFYRGRRDRLAKEQAAEGEALSGRYGQIIGWKGATGMDAAQTLEAARKAKATLEGGSLTGESEVERLKKITDLEKLIVDLVKQQEASKREIAKLTEEERKALYAAAAKKMQDDLKKVQDAIQAEKGKLEGGTQGVYATDKNIADIQARNLPVLREDLQAMSTYAIGPEQIQAVQDMGKAFREVGAAVNTTSAAMAQLKGTIASMAVQSLTQFWMDLASAQMSVGDSAMKMAQSFVSSLLQMVTEALMMKAVFTMLNLPMPGGSLAAMFSTGGAVVKKAEGGAIYGPGTGTSDSIPALLSNGEHVLTAAEVQAAGGHGAIYRLRESIRSGSRFAEGGAVGSIAGVALDAGSSSASLEVGMEPGLVARIVDEHLSGPGMKTIIKSLPNNRKAFNAGLQ